MKALLAFLQYLPHILNGVVAVESALGSGNGATKKQIILNAVVAAAQVGEGVPETHVQGISKVIDATVQVLNATGLAGFGNPAPNPNPIPLPPSQVPKV